MRETVRRLRNLIACIEDDCVTQSDIDEVSELLKLLRPKFKLKG